MLAGSRLTAVVALLAPLAACDFVESGSGVPESRRDAAVEARILASPDDPVAVQGAILIVEPDPLAGRSFGGPKQSFMSDGEGLVRADIVPGHGARRRGGRVGSSFEVAPPPIDGDACLRLIHEGRFSAQRCGVRLRTGQALDAGTFYVSEFSTPSLEEDDLAAETPPTVQGRQVIPGAVP